MQERHTDRKRYFIEQALTTGKYYIPYIRRHIGDIPGEVLEVGCGEGGNLLPFARLGCSVTGVDIVGGRIAQARKFFAEEGAKGTFIASDIFKLRTLENKFRLVLVHDVIEHIDDKVGFLSGLSRLLAPGGVVFMAFPAWQMPFGGHQQIAASRVVSHFPFLHLMPDNLYKRTLQRLGEDEPTVNELMSIKHTRCSIEKFQSALYAAGFRAVHRQLYLINPHYETKFGLKPRKLARAFSSIPYLRNFFSTSCFYLITPARSK